MPEHGHYPQVDPIRSGIAGHCPRCGEGKLFNGFLTVAPRCTACGLDYGFADSGDGPAAFVILILIIGFIVVGLALWRESILARRSGYISFYGCRLQLY
ncbi:hypothetical protein P053_02185 [Brucella abortus 01-4165]|nr:hypothetical protein BAA13334_I03172 [Brucella abortus A13334]AIJ52492.1 hypothetical protein DK48_1621 [Brucella abortus]AIJ59914.1 hypothetical protein DK53_495 [Brucella abortus bv. 9 str. C68]AIJ64766.1 hypothetical protein DO74_1382 [Brucella abortus bv. 6 str. 870]AIJ92602.1 hypothetical protein DK55_505 [Brucella abortus bv. 2 str. 86/8/59]ALF29113.1 hypothetical protein NL70_02370 [Brucella abortus 104M]AOG43240.1 hypothetical protein BFS01_02355 [Brucella sp. 2002734562]EEW81075.